MPKDNTWTLYSNNNHAWQAILNDCSVAKQSIFLEQFIFANDEFGSKLINICKERAGKGVEVKFLWDSAGSFSFNGNGLINELGKAGIQLVFWKSLIPSINKLKKVRTWFFRNHRRTIVIDDEIGYTGSISIANDFAGWRETNVRFEGPIVVEMKNAFMQMWQRANKKRPQRSIKSSKYNTFQYITNYPAPGRRKIYSTLVKAIKKSKEYIYITVPYFVPTHRLIRTLKGALKRGVDIKIILPEKSDHYFVDLGARAFFHTLLKAGAEIYLYKGNMIHSKVVIIDDIWSTVGSMNLDSLSLLYNFEGNIVSNDYSFTKELKSHFDNDLKECQKVDFEQWKKRGFMSKFMTFIAHIIKKFL